MSFKMKALAATVAFMAAGTANATIDTFGTGNGELFLSVRDNSTTAPMSYVLDLNKTIDAWDGSISQSWAADATLQNFLASGSGNYSWAVMAGDNNGAGVTNGLRYLTTAASTAESLIETEKNTGLIAWTIMDTYVNNVNAKLLANSSDSATFLGTDTGFFEPTKDFWQNNAPMNAAAALGDVLSFFLVTNTGSTTAFATKNLPVDAIAYAGTWTLNANGLSYNVASANPVPVPAAVWLLGSALVGLVGVARRREEA